MTEIILGILWVVFGFSFLVLLIKDQIIGKRLRKSENNVYRLDRLEKKTDVVGEYYKIYDGKVESYEFRKGDILDEIDGNIKIRYAFCLFGNGSWVSKKDILYYDRIDKKAEAEIIKRLERDYGESKKKKI